ncbi:MAG: acetyl-CoA carboxylase carboxyltransferase subunit alpha [Parachlamydiales bacterium]|nr:acetyl-CoA carboxylase carboxyltransferase subunit alpha [Parachlamydiales bacterium]
MDTLPHERQIHEYEKTIRQFKEQSGGELLSSDDIRQLEKKLEKLKKKAYSQLSPWERVQICRHPTRPHTIDYIKNICTDFVELFGDRNYADDKAIVGGLAMIDGVKWMVIGQEKGNDTESRMYRNFGMPHPEGYRKALRLMRLAEKFQLPVLSFIDTAGAFPGLSAEERGQAWAIAENLREMARLKTPIVVVIVGEASSGGAIAMAVGDSIGMLEHAYYSVITPEGCASILWKDAGKNTVAAQALKLTAEDVLSFEIIDQIIKEPLGGAHHDPDFVYVQVKTFLKEQWASLKNLPPEVLLEKRYAKFRRLGKYTTSGV